MTAAAIDPALDLELRRVIAAPPEALWRAWTDSELLARWWTPAPSATRVDVLDVRPGGGLVTSICEGDEPYMPHTDAVFLVVEESRRLVFTNAVDSAWRPAAPDPVAMSAEVVFGAHPDGTDYRVIVRHGDPPDRTRHEELGFFDGWGAITDQLAAIVEDEG